MFTVNNYVMPESLKQAYELNQSLRNVVLGGTLWLKMGRKKIGTAIDLSALGLHTIEEHEHSFEIGCMCTLRELELHQGLNSYFNGALAKAVENIVGVQFRNGATVGGSVFARFGFSDVLTVLLALDSYVELYKGGIVALADFVNMPRNKDILVRLIIKKDTRKVAYSSFRKSASDLPVLNCAVSNYGGVWNIVLGSRPQRAKLIAFNASANLSQAEINAFIEKIQEEVALGTNYRGSKEYRQILAGVMIQRNIEEITIGGTYAD